MFLVNLATLLLAIPVIIIIYFKWKFSYWKKRNVPYLEPTIPFGNLENPARSPDPLGVVVKKIYEEIKLKKWRHAGVYFITRPTYFVLDPEYIKNVMTKDFQFFVNRGLYYNEKDDPLSANLLAIEDTKWRNLRTKLTSTFTSGKMKMMFHIFQECEKKLQEKINILHQTKEPIDIKEVLGCFTTDIIGCCAFGLELNNFKDEDSFFRKYGREIFIMSFKKRLQMVLTINFPQVAKFFGVVMTEKHIGDFFMQIVKDTVEYREKNNCRRQDFMQLLIDLKNNKLAEEEGYQHDGKTLTIEEIAAQSFIFFLAGYETSSTTMTFALYELSQNQQIQEKVRQEIRFILDKHKGEITYESIQEMKYLNQVIDETLRKYPPIPFISRQCVKDYKVPDQDVIIEKGTRVIIPVLGIHYNEEFYPDPEKFDPERFNEENLKTRHQYVHLPFGEGPRNCIGLRFGLLQSKVGLASLLRNYKFTVSEKTKQPLKFAVTSFILAADGEVWLNAEKV